MIMDISSITETLNKIDSDGAKIKFLEKCLLEEKSDYTKLKIIDLLRKLNKNKVSFENYLRQLVKEKKIELIKGLMKQSTSARVSKEERKSQNIQLEAVIESEIERNKLIEALSPAAAIPPRATDSKVYTPRDERAINDEGYKQKSVQEGYRPKEQKESSSYTPKTETQEGYKKNEQFKLGVEEDEGKKEYKRKVLKGVI